MNLGKARTRARSARSALRVYTICNYETGYRFTPVVGGKETAAAKGMAGTAAHVSATLHRSGAMGVFRGEPRTEKKDTTGPRDSREKHCLSRRALIHHW